MRRSVVGFVLLVLGLSAGLAAASATNPLVWSEAYSTRARPNAAPTGLAVSPDGATVFVGGSSGSSGRPQVGDVIAYSAATGARIWTTRITARAGFAVSHVVVDPSGARVFVIGDSLGATHGLDSSAALAFDASTGAQVWRARPVLGLLSSAVVTVDGGRLYATGSRYSANGVNVGAVTVAYDAGSGAVAWIRRASGTGNSGIIGQAVSVDPAGEHVIVSGTPHWPDVPGGYELIEYGSDGTKLWTARAHPPTGEYGTLSGATMSPDGTAIVATGMFQQGATRAAVSVAFAVSTGATLWTARYLGPGESAVGSSVTFGPLGDRVFVTGSSYGAGNDDLTTIGYDAGTGAQLWVSRYNGPANGTDGGAAVAASSDGNSVVVSGFSMAASKEDAVTLAIDPVDGTTRWVDRYDSPAQWGTFATGLLAISPDSTRAFVAAYSVIRPTEPASQITTLAYDVSP
jgi:hypothetical protein